MNTIIVWSMQGYRKPTLLGKLVKLENTGSPVGQGLMKSFARMNWVAPLSSEAISQPEVSGLIKQGVRGTPSVGSGFYDSFMGIPA